jgi:hypothetical protein
MSAPATNAFSPAPVNTIARTPSSSPSASNAVRISPRSAWFSAFNTAGRLMVTTATAPSCSRFRNS